ncbi:hypothetical protein [Streptomyces litchfieldiae]|uniref:Uncharacterized protein n=1 Tax=Streptomyces litchfieldiae TaxID=3075543 RepID=A0ABU2MNU3_9ACTN|nr:hypothetical protein [Streptomyces sp. DSM 44938]MDT0343062.1 hypothetical protein [Streptomyces sp. DSM 44938]
MRAARCLGFLLGAASAGGAGLYLVVYLYRWEWQRALISGVLLLVIEVLLVGAVLLGRMGRLHQRLAESDARSEAVLRRLEESREEAPGRFRWLDGGPPGGAHVFVPVLMATGAALSGLALFVQKLASTTARPGAERRLAGRLAKLAAPPGGVRGNGPGLTGHPAVPPPRPRRVATLVTVALAGAAGVALLVNVLSDATQTRPAAPPDSAASTIVFRVAVRNTDADRAGRQAARALWEGCRRSTSVLREHAPLVNLEGDVYVGVLRPALPEHDLRRLRGCLSDLGADRTRAEVLGEGQALTGDDDS